MTKLLTRDTLAAIRDMTHAHRRARAIPLKVWANLPAEQVVAHEIHAMRFEKHAEAYVTALLAHIDALEAALRATYDADNAAWVVESPDPLDAYGTLHVCAFCDRKLFSSRTIHSYACQGEALKLALGLDGVT